jgi:hypothetical protein
MLNLISKASPRTSARIAYKISTLAEKLGATVKEDKDSNRYFIKTKRRQYIVASRCRKHREAEVVYGETYKGYHAGYLSVYREYNDQDRDMWDVQRRDIG